jgi:proteasome lid subunit RPN8/RPN11
MTSADDRTFAAIITINLPGMAAAEKVTVTLAPPDLVTLAGGATKPLEECTLAELVAFAETLEAEVLEQYRQHSLRELTDTGRVELEITLLEETVAAVSTDDMAEPEMPAAAEAGEAVEDRPMQAGLEATAPAKEVAAPEETPGSLSDGMADATIAAPAVEEAPAEAAETAEETVAEASASAELPPAAESAPPPGEDDVAVAGVLPPAEPAVEMAPAPRKLRIAGLRRPLGHPTPAAADILINESAFRDAQAHALSSLDREVAGMLIGPPPEKQPDGRYVVHVSDIIIAKHTKMHGASVTYTPESWRYVTDKLHEHYPNEEAVIVGWYHTHPGFGIFLSGMDLFIHQNFFTQKWHIALVLDPHARKSGFFCWDRGQTAVQPYDFPWPAWAAGSW